MAISDATKIDYSFKKLKTLGRTSGDKAYYEESEPGGIIIDNKDLVVDTIPGTPPATTTSIVKCYIPTPGDGRLLLTEDTSVANSKCWKAEVGGVVKKNWIPPAYATAYAARIFESDNSTEIPTTDASDWIFDYKSGVLTFQDTCPDTGGIYLHAYLYVGNLSAIADIADVIDDTHIDWGTGANQVSLDDVPDGTSYERVAAAELSSGIYKDATTAVKGIASFNSANFGVSSGDVTIKTGGVGPTELVSTAVTPGSYTSTDLTVDADGRITAASNGAGGTDEKVGVDSVATAGYIGAASNDGVLRTSSPLTYSDGGDYVTLGVDETAIDHDNLLNFAANEHFTEASIDHGSIDGLSDDDHTQYILHSLADAANDFIVASGDDAFVKKTLAEAGAILEGDIDHGNIQGLDTGADHSYIDQDVTSGATPTFTGTNITAVASITAADESADTTCFPLFATATTGTVSVKTGTNLTFNSNTGLLTATTLAGANTNWDAAYTHVSNDGSDHSFIDQDVTSGSAPTFTADSFSDGGSNAIVTTTQETNWDTHLSSDGSDHTFIDQDVTSGSSPTLDGTNFTGIPDGALDSTFLKNVVEDTTPQLGGELDCQANTVGFTQQTATGDGTTTIDWTAGNKFKFTFGAQNDTFTFNPAPTKPCNLILMMIQDGTGSRTATWPATVKWPSGTAPTLSTGANDVDIISFYWDGTNYFGQSALDFSVPV